MLDGNHLQWLVTFEMFGIFKILFLLIPGIGQLMTRQISKGIDLILLTVLALLPIIFQNEQLRFLSAICKIIFPFIWVYSAVNVFSSFYFSYLDVTRHRRLVLVCVSMGLLAEAVLLGRTQILKDLSSADQPEQLIFNDQNLLPEATLSQTDSAQIPVVTPPQITIKTEQSRTVTDEERKIESVDRLKQFIDQKKLHLQAKDKAYLVVDVSQQCLWLLKQQQVLDQYLVSTARAGTGNLRDSFQTPIGRHQIYAKVGSTAPKGSVFEGGFLTEKIQTNLWDYELADPKVNDIITTRIIKLTGLEEGKNKGGDVDTLARRIYIHGTTNEKMIGQPTSQGCIRMINDDIITLFDQVEVGGLVYVASRLN